MRTVRDRGLFIDGIERDFFRRRRLFYLMCFIPPSTTWVEGSFVRLGRIIRAFVLVLISTVGFFMTELMTEVALVFFPARTVICPVIVPFAQFARMFVTKIHILRSATALL